MHGRLTNWEHSFVRVSRNAMTAIAPAVLRGGGTLQNFDLLEFLC